MTVLLANHCRSTALVPVLSTDNVDGFMNTVKRKVPFAV